jgi:hypothetical protein
VSDDAARQIMTITIAGFPTVTLAPNNIPMSEKLIVRKATGLPFEAFLADEDKIGADSVAVMWWLARRANGEPMLTWKQASEDWPTDLKAEDATDPEA